LALNKAKMHSRRNGSMTLSARRFSCGDFESESLFHQGRRNIVPVLHAVTDSSDGNTAASVTKGKEVQECRREWVIKKNTAWRSGPSAMGLNIGDVPQGLHVIEAPMTHCFPGNEPPEGWIPVEPRGFLAAEDLAPVLDRGSPQVALSQLQLELPQQATLLALREEGVRVREANIALREQELQLRTAVECLEQQHSTLGREVTELQDQKKAVLQKLAIEEEKLKTCLHQQRLVQEKLSCCRDAIAYAVGTADQFYANNASETELLEAGKKVAGLLGTAVGDELRPKKKTTEYLRCDKENIDPNIMTKTITDNGVLAPNNQRAPLQCLATATNFRNSELVTGLWN